MLGLLLILFGLVASATTAQHVRGNERDLKRLGKANARIINGTTAAAGTYPYFVLFPGATCGGTLIAPDKVLTSASCIITQNPTQLRVGASSMTDGQVIDVACYRIHPDYFRTPDSIYNDVGVIKLMQSVSDITPVELNDDLSNPRNKEPVTAMGFGITQPDGLPSTTLQAAQVSYVEIESCQPLFPPQTINGFQHVCANSPNKGTCTGDGGGPLLDATGKQVGVVSFTYGEDCADPTVPDVYANVAAYIGWINIQISDSMCNVGEDATVAPAPAPAPGPTPPETTEGDSDPSSSSSSSDNTTSTNSDSGGDDGDVATTNINCFTALFNFLGGLANSPLLDVLDTIVLGTAGGGRK